MLELEYLIVTESKEVLRGEKGMEVREQDTEANPLNEPQIVNAEVI